MKMGSRRTMTRSQSRNERSLNGSEVSGSSRSPGCSYLSNVRPETRSTLCSVIAQLTEETQPFFEETLKSRAVSESCNVKFTCIVTGYPTPQLTWYKDDIQLDRYCGLPKYEIFRNGHNHSLHIYNCTVEDAAIYQASASNSKGIVSCSGVLEVGEMNEFKIHQRYFSKLKQKAENKRKEAEEKENQEPARTISPDRVQRKRHSNVGGYISAPCSVEEESRQDTAAEVKARVQESNVDEVKDTKEGSESREQHPLGQGASSTADAHKQDSVQKVFAAVQPKTFFKKFKTSNTKVGPEKKSSSVDILPQSQWTAEGSMEVESSASANSVLPPFKSLKRRVTSIVAKEELSKENVVSKTEEVNVNLKVQHESYSSNSSPVMPPRASKQQQSQPQIKQISNTSPKGKNTIKKVKCSGPVTTSHADTSCDSGTALPQSLCQQARQDPPQKETRPTQKEGCVSERGLKREATQTHAKAQRNEAPVTLELQAKLSKTVAPEGTPAERTEQDRRGPSLHRELHKATDKMTRDTQDHSRGSTEICAGLSTDTQKPPMKSPVAGEKSNISPTARQRQLNTLIKTVEGTEIHLDEKTNCNETGVSIAQTISSAVNKEGDEKFAPEMAEDGNTTNDKAMGMSNKQKDFKCLKETATMSLETRVEPLMANKEEIISESVSKDFQKCPSPIPTILSIAELLRSQINALEESISSQISINYGTENQPGRIEESNGNTDQKTNKKTCADRGPTIKETLMQIYNELLKTKDLFEDEVPVLSKSVQPSQSPEICPVDSVIEVALPSKINEQEDSKNQYVQNNGFGEKSRQTPEIKVNTEEVENEAVSEILNCNREMIQLTFKTDDLEPVQVLHEKNISDFKKDSFKDSPGSKDSVKENVFANAIHETDPLIKTRECVSISSATPQELASGARRKINPTKTKAEEREPSSTSSETSSAAVPVSLSPRLSRQSALLSLSSSEQEAPKKKRSPHLSRKKSPVEIQSQSTQESADTKSEESPLDKPKNDPYKAPQVIRKIRGETFSDHSGNMKLWCQFFNVLSESTVTWHRDKLAIAKIIKCVGDETQVSLALAQATPLDTGCYQCTITNEYGTDSTDFLLSAEVLAGMSLREDLGVGEEIELIPLLFNKGVTDCMWGNKLFGRIMVQQSHLGKGFSHKTWRAKVIYGLEPLFESGNSCILKVCNPIAYGGKEESLLVEKNQEVVKQACKIQNLAREYCKIFSAEARTTERFGFLLEVMPVYLMYRPSNSIPYATVEADLVGVYSQHCGLNPSGMLTVRSTTEVEQKCCTLQHWIFQWTSGNLLFTKLEGVDSKITNVGISVKYPGHQGLSLEANPKVFEQFVIQHHCNYFCGLLGLQSLKVIDSLLMPTKPKGSKSPLTPRKISSGASSPQTGRKSSASPRAPRKIEQES